jgi:hypothetical protein
MIRAAADDLVLLIEVVQDDLSGERGGVHTGLVHDLTGHAATGFDTEFGPHPDRSGTRSRG